VSQVIFIYIALFTMEIVLKQLYSCALKRSFGFLGWFLWRCWILRR